MNRRFQKTGILILCLTLLLGCISGCGKPEDSIVAACGDQKLSADTFEYFYWMEYEAYVNAWGSVLNAEDSTAEFDPYHSLAAQKRRTDDRTWQEYFIDCAMDTVQEYLALAAASEADETYSFSQENQELIELAMADIERQAELGSFESADALIQNLFFEKATLEGYKRYYTIYVKANAYYDYLRDNLDVDNETILDQFTYNADAYIANGLDSTDNRSMVQYRHILIRPEGDTELEWSIAKGTAETILDDFIKSGSDLTTFEELAMAYSGDANSYQSGGLYQHVYPGEFEESMDSWLFETNHEIGDTAVVQTSSGWHVMYFGGYEGIPYWYYTAATDYTSLKMADILSELVDANPLEQFRDRIVLTDLPKA